jgi:hypothetical protein
MRTVHGGVLEIAGDIFGILYYMLEIVIDVTLCWED